MENKELREELQALIDSASLLLDDRIYTFDTYRDLIAAVAYGKVICADENATEEKLNDAIDGINEAVDAMEPIPEETKDPVRKAAPFLLGGALLGGLILGSSIAGKKKKKKSRTGKDNDI